MSEDGLTTKQQKALASLLSHRTTKEAAKACGVTEMTLWRWMQLSAFQSQYRAARRQLVESAIAQLQVDATVAVRVLREVAEDTEAPAAARVTAARTILEQSISAVELTDLMERVEQLEGALVGGKQRQTA